MAFPALSSQSVFLLSILSVIFEPWKAQSCLDLHVHNRIKSDKISPGMSERSYSTTTSITHGSPRSSAYSISSQSSRGSDTMGYEERSSYSLRVPVTEAQAKYDSNDRIQQVNRDGVSVINHNKRISEPMAPRSSDAIRTGYYR